MDGHRYVELFLRTQNNKHRTNGFVCLLLDLNKLVESISIENSGADNYYRIDLYQVDNYEIENEGQTSFFRIFYQRRNELSYEFLDYFFGKVYKIVVVPGTGFFNVYGNNAFLSVFIVGLLLTLVVSAFFVFMVNRRYLLEKQIDKYSFQLKESQDRFISLFSNMLEGVAFLEMLYDSDGNAINYRILEVNETFLSLTGLSGKNIIGTDAITLFGKALYIEDFRKVVEDKKPQIIQKYFEQTDRHFKISIAPWGTHGFATIFSDITQRVKAEEKLKKSEEKYRLLVENQNDLIVKINKEGHLLYVSPSYCRLFGKSEEELLNKKFAPLVQPGNNSGAMKKLTQPPYQVTIEQRALTNEGWKWISWNHTAIVDEGTGEINEIIGVGRDVTEQKKAEMALQESRELLERQNEEYASLNEEYLTMNEELTSINEDLSAAIERAEESEKLKTAFLQNMSHEIRTPLNAIIGFSEMLGMDYLTDTDRKEFISIIVNSGRQLLELVNDILTISAIETRQEKINMGRVNLNEVLSELYTIFKSRAKEKGLTLKVTKPTSGDLILQTDEVKFRQIFINLIGNALKFTSEGEIEFGYDLEDEGFIRFFVRDTGVGIPKARQEKIFERFMQADNSIKSTYGGTGLGLAISKGHVEMMGGKIWLESTPGVGSVFYFSLPRFDDDYKH
jgi:PAS domain S-box-containing protein